MRNIPTVMMIWIISVCPIVRAEDVPRIHLGDFNQLSQEDRLHVILTGMREYQGQLSNCLLILHEQLTGYLDRKGGVSATPSVSTTRQVEIRILTPCYMLTYDRVWRNADNEEKLRMNWDGQTEQIWSWLKPNKFASGAIQNEQDNILGKIWFCQQLGIRTEPPEMQPIPDFIEDMSHEKKPPRTYPITYESRLDETGENRAIVLLIGGAFQKYEYAIDPDRQFIIARSRRFNIANGQEFPLFEMTTDEIRNVNGVWLPWKVTRRNSDGHEHLAYAAEYTVQEAKFGTVTKKDLEFSFEPNTRAIDLVKEEAYFIDKDGKKIMKPYIDPKTGREKAPASTEPATHNDGSN